MHGSLVCVKWTKTVQVCIPMYDVKCLHVRRGWRRSHRHTSNNRSFVSPFQGFLAPSMLHVYRLLQTSCSRSSSLFPPSSHAGQISQLEYGKRKSTCLHLGIGHAGRYCSASDSDYLVEAISSASGKTLLTILASSCEGSGRRTSFPNSVPK